MSARTMLAAALQKKTARAVSSAVAPAPASNAPPAPAGVDSPKAYAAGEFHPAVKVAPSNAGGKAALQKGASVVDWLCKSAGLTKTAAKRPGRLDGDEALDKLAKLHSKRKRT